MDVFYFQWIVYLLLMFVTHHEGVSSEEICDVLTADLVVITDNSGSVGSDNYDLEIAFVADLFNSLTISPNEVRVGVIDYSTYINSQTFGFFDPDFDTNAEVTNEVLGFNYIGGYTRTDLAIEEAEAFLSSPGVRAGIPKIVILLTDGITNNGGYERLQDVVPSIKQNIPDLKIITVGIGDYDVIELSYIATDPSLIFEVEDFDALDDIIDEVLVTVCTPLPPPSCLGENCTADSECFGANVVCDPVLNICLCAEGFLLTQLGECVNCSTVDFEAYLSTLPCNDISFCPSNQVLIGSTCYGTLVGESCTTELNTCTDKNAICNGTVCECIDGYTYNGSHCVGTEPCELCGYDPDTCSGTFVCSPNSGRCECPDATPIQYDGDCYGTRVTEKCTNDLNTCTDCHAYCNGTVCDCEQGYMWNGTHCVGDGLCDQCSYEPDSCAPDLVCGVDSGRCECPPELPIQYNGDCYGTRITEKCTNDLNTCTDCHAYCNGTVCDCEQGYIWNGTHCVGDGLCDQCSYEPDSCAPDLVCGVDSGRCECPPELPIQYNGDCYGTRVTEKCTTDLNTCTDCHAYCNGTVCDCEQGYMWNGTHCAGDGLCDQCSYEPDSCAPDLVCGVDSGRCECPPELPIQYNGDCYGTRVTEKCTTDLNTCTDCHAYCNGTVCDCEQGYIWNGTHCVGDGLCDQCSYEPDSCAPDLVCGVDSGRCECPPELPIQYNGDCYGTRVTEKCTNDLNTCTDCHAYCNGTVCDCEQGYMWNGTHCVGDGLCDQCSYEPDSCAPDLVCGVDSGRCECPPELPIQYNGDCYGTRVTEKCTTDLNTCTDCHAYCNGTVCDCEQGYIWNGTHCVGDGLCDQCSYEPYSCAPDLVCGVDSGRCECPPELPIQYNGDCYGTRVTEKCTTDLNTCTDCHAYCNGTVCDCEQGYIWNGTHCVGDGLCDQCSYEPDSCAPDLVCGVDSGRCECPPELPIQYNGDCYGTRVTEKCTTDLNTCTDCHAYCNGTVCDCEQGYMWNGTHCVGDGLCDQCSYEPDSCAPDLVCGVDSGRCECPPELPIQYNGDCYGTRVTEKCTTDLNTCTDCHAYCNGTVCDCEQGYIWNGTHCVGDGLCDQCSYEPDSCAPDLVCGVDSGRCECPPELPIQYNGDCYGTRVTEKCTTDLNTCTDCHAYCNGTVCDCEEGYMWNGTHCVGSLIDDQCDSFPDSCLINGLVCGPTYRCECPGVEVQIGNECYSLTCEECTNDTDCLYQNQVCAPDGSGTNICQCNNSYYLDPNCGICVPKVDLNEGCSSDNECLSGFCICFTCQANDDNDFCDDCVDFRSDIVFVTDASGSVGETDYQKIKAFMLALANAFHIGESDTRIAHVDYSWSINSYFYLDVFDNNFDVSLELINLEFSSGTTRTDLGLDVAYDILSDSGNRAGIPNYVIVITDGQTTSPYNTDTLPASISNLKSIYDTTIYTVGIGDYVLSELQSIASGNEFVYTTPSFDTLDNLVDDLLFSICNPLSLNS